MDTPSKKTTRARDLATKLHAECVGTRVGRLQRVVSRRFSRSLRPLGLTLSQMEVLAALLLHAEPVTPTALADFLVIERSTMSRNLALMTTAGWVEAAETSPGHRSMAVTITTAGSDKLLAARAAWNVAQTRLLETLGADVVRELDRWVALLE